jgi:hypothetical protein
MSNVSEVLFPRFRRITKRAERILDEQRLEDTFVNIAGIDDIAFNPENQILYGRRGTGKTHALKYLKSIACRRGEVALLIDLRSTGSEGSNWSDRNVPVEVRVPKIVTDIFASIHEALYEAATSPNSPINLGDIAQDMDRLADQIGRVVVPDTVEVGEGTQDERELSSTVDVAANWRAAIELEARHQRATKSKSGATKSKREVGKYRYKLHFQSLMMIFRSIFYSIGRRTWILLDEWSIIPEDIQPFVADSLKRALFPINLVTVIIAAIEHRSRFQSGISGSIVGIEVGADCPAAVNLDEYLVYENNKEGAIEFYSNLLFLHTETVDSTGLEPLNLSSSSHLIASAFSNAKCFQELVIASEGVPRDFINILAIASSRTGNRKINFPAIRGSARQWFEQDKSKALVANDELRLLLAWIADRVIGDRKARAFLVESGSANSGRLMDLFDSRLVHVIKRSISAQDQPGVRYVAYKLDYGCYVDLLSTARKPAGLFANDDAERSYVDVPPDDYRSIRRSVLDLSEFNLQTVRDRIRSLAKSSSTDFFTSIISSLLVSRP